MTYGRNKDELIRDPFLWTPTHKYINMGRPTKIYNHQLCTNIGYRLEHLSRAMASIDGEIETERKRERGGRERKRVKRINIVGTL